MAPADCVGMREVPGTRAAFLKPSILNLSRLHTCRRKAPELSISAPAFASSATAIMSGEIKARPVLTRSPTDFGLFFTGQKKKESETEPLARSFYFAIGLRSLRRNVRGEKARQFHVQPFRVGLVLAATKAKA